METKKRKKGAARRLFRRALALAMALALAAGLCACGASVPEGMEEEAVKQAAEQTIRLLDEGDYAALMDTMDDTLREAMTEEDWAETWQPLAQELGALTGVERHSLVEKDGFAVDVAKAQYENGALTFTLSYDTAYRLAGIYMK